ncbi:MAG: T9SS type A sorting domain-containing protein, partial [Bacteroidales bacterium]|nr:T9SS type A sorting domain-containing protein [Bacteroidales bacterium]
KVYPNPTRGNVFIQHENAIIERVVITDLSGRTVAIIPVNDYIGTLDLSSLPNGLYLLRIEQVDGAHIMHKIIKE